MASSLQKKFDPPLRLVSDEEAVVYPDDARPTDDTPTIISKTMPLVEPAPSSQNKKPSTAIQAGSPEAIVDSLRGRKLAHFELIAPIGVGGMAAVIRARDTQLDRIVALKVLPPEMAKEPENIERFHHEARSAAKLDHANIARVFHYGADQGLHFIAFEFVDGINLRAMLEKRGKLPVVEAIRYIVQIATGLEHSASRGVVHRDVKPSNIIITPQGQAKLVDMGLARNLERHGERDLTQSGMTLGTFDYISPEQALEPREADVRSDIYSLGCTLYHLLTGQAPVPEGTPAKKLDHHQHHEPTDPRVYNPEIPDEVVKILGKMMAKNPKDRYQQPIQVVHHLMQAAQQIGGAEGMPEVLLFTDMPLPSEPGRRPMLFIGLALAALLVMVTILSFAPDPTPNGPGNSNKKSDGEAKGSTPTPDGGGPQAKGPGGEPAAAPPKVVQNREELKRVLDAAKPEFKALISEQVDLKSEGLTFKGTSDQKLEVRGEGQHQIVRFSYTKSGSPFGLELKGGGEVTFRQIKFQIDSGTSPDRIAAGLAVRGVKKVIFDQCIFQQNVPIFAQTTDITVPKLVPIASVYIAGADGVKPTVELKDCYFYGGGPSGGGQVAIAIDGDADVKVTNTAFRPHGAFFSFRDKCTLDETSLKVDRCAGFVEMGPAFRFSNTAAARLDVGHSVFARPDGGIPVSYLSGQAGLIYFAGDNPIQFEGRYNLYYNLNDLLERKQGLLAKESDFKNFLEKERRGADVGSLHFDQGNSPLNFTSPLQRLLDDTLAFQLNKKYYKEYGLNKTWTGSDMPPPPIVLAKALKKIVDVDADDGAPTPGEKAYKYLGSHLSEAVHGDTIWIKHGKDSKEVEVSPFDLKPGRTVTLKPHPGFEPILVLDKSKEETVSYLFKLQKSKLQIEQMKIHIIAPSKGYDLRSVVQAGEAAHLVFKNCTFVMRAGHPDGKLNLVTLFDLDPVMMKMDTPATPPRVEFHECFIRGKGDLVSLRGCRKLTVDIDDSLIALDGSLLDIDAGSKEMAPDEGVQWNMIRSSVYTKKSIFNLRAPTGKGLAMTRATVRDCLLASLSPDQPEPVVTLVLNKEKVEKIKKHVSWDGGHNFYANFFDVNRDDILEWKGQVAEMDQTVGKLTFSDKLEEVVQALREPTADLFKSADPQMEKMIAPFGMPPEMQKALFPAPADPEQP